MSPRREVPPHIPRPDYADGGRSQRALERTLLPPEAIARLRRSCQAAAEVLRYVGELVRPGITTEELDIAAHEEIIRRNAYPSPLNYNGFPKSICTSVNEVICHGIPDSRPLVEGDIINLDITLYREGMHGDTSATYLVGRVDPESRRLVQVTQECLDLGIRAVRPGGLVREIGAAIESHATRHGFGVVRAYCGHGIGATFHTPLHIPHFYDRSARLRLEPGMAFTIEPMITYGRYDFRIWDDKWTAVTQDGLRTAQFEHTVLVTPEGVEVLTHVPGAAGGI